MTSSIHDVGIDIGINNDEGIYMFIDAGINDIDHVIGLMLLLLLIPLT